LLLNAFQNTAAVEKYDEQTESDKAKTIGPAGREWQVNGSTQGHTGAFLNVPDAVAVIEKPDLMVDDLSLRLARDATLTS
jgi:hypothetical protein